MVSKKITDEEIVSYLNKELDQEKLDLIEEKTLMAVQTENYEYIEKLLETGVISSRMKVNGKPLIIHAAIHDKPEMILLLATYGAMLIEPLCDDGKDIMEYAKEINPNDEIIEDKGVKLFVDPGAIMYLLGTEMDYKKEELSSSFVFNNPNETERCGCGESFKID